MAVLSAEAADGADGPTLWGELEPADAEAPAEAGIDLDVSVEIDAFCLALWAAARALSRFL